MFDERFELNDQTISMVEEIGRHMPGGFFIYRAEGNEELLYANHATLAIFGCKDLEEFRQLTGFTFKGMLHPEDYVAISNSINDQIEKSDDNLDYVEYRIIRKDGAVRWVDDYGHYTETEAYGGIYYVFISDITEKRERMASDMAVRQAVIEALSDAYHTVWLINDVETESFSLYRGDTEGKTIHSVPIKDALSRMKYSQAKEYYIKTTVAPEDQERLERELDIRNLAKNVREKNQFSVNYLRVMDDGSQRYFRIEFAKVDMPGGRLGVVCGFKDVDEESREQMAVQQALHDAKLAEEENRRLVAEIESVGKMANFMGSVGQLLTNMPAMTFTKDAKTGQYLVCNQSFAEFAGGNRPEDIQGYTDYELFEKSTADRFRENDRTALSMEEPFIFVEEVPDVDGGVRSYQTTKQKFTDGTGRLCLLGMRVDVTEMTRTKQAETEARIKQQELEGRIALQEKLLEESRQREQQERLITALASDYRSVYYIELDRNHGICYQGYAGAEDLPKAGDEFLYVETFTEYARRYVAEAYRQEFIDFIQPDAVRAGLAASLVISYRYLVKRDGKEAYEMVRFAGVRHPEDRADHLVHTVGACFTDVDAETRRDLEQSQALSYALATAEQANKAKTAFLSNMSHEIRTPMNAIIGLNNIAMNDPDATEHMKEYLQKMGSSAHHLLNIINDILDMSRIESGRMVIRSEEFSFSKALEQVNTIISEQCRDKNVKYECNIIGHVENYYIGDDMKLRQVLINILGNAVKFTPEGGEVHFTVEAFAHFEHHTTLRFIIRDTGIGMKPEFLPHIFDAFSQEDASATNKYGSTGLGMPITKSIVELMNGTIEVESEKGKGSTFTVTITFTDSERQEEEEDIGISPADMNVLVIDDDPVACEHAKLILGKIGISCDAADSGFTALEMVKVRHARRENYNLILVDWRMPEMDGIETTRKIREIVGGHIPIIILTSFNWDDVAEEAKEAGVDSFVPKPIFAANVMEAFREALKRKNYLLQSGKVDLAGRRILLAEDVPVNAEIMMMILSMREMQVDLAENGRIAVELFASHEDGYYDAILMDMRMPEMDGLEASRRIRDMDRADAKKVPIIALTANAFDEDVQRSMQAGLNAHLSKPVEAENLYSTLESLIRI